MPRAKRIFLIRHGQSASNVDITLHSHTPDHKIPLTQLGLQQAAEAGKTLAGKFAGERVSVYYSPFLRTRQTWSQIREQLPTELIYKEREDPRIREQEWGNFQNLDEMEIIDKERDAYGPFYYRLPNGESGADVYDRCTTFLDTLYRDFERADFPPNVLIVSHGLTIRLLLMRWLHYTVEEFENFANPKNCQIFEMALDEKENRYKLLTPFGKWQKKETQTK